MKVFWLTNYPLPYIAEKVDLPKTVNEGWLIGLADVLGQNGWEIVFCSVCEHIEKNIVYADDKIKFYGIKSLAMNKYASSLKHEFERCLQEENPDVIHIMGSEFPHSYSLFEACKTLGIEKKCVLSIQGIISKIAQAYDIAIDSKHKRKRILWDMLIKDSILLNKKDFQYRGIYEKKLLKEIPNVIGRTEWDCLCVKQINPEVKYYKCNEILRSVFYNHRWDYEQCEEQSIIISQATYPVKGFHILLKAVAMLKGKYPHIKVYVPSQTVYPKALNRIYFLNSDYANYIVKLIRDNDLEKNVVFLGALNAEEMCRAYLKSNVFVCSSTIENSSNSLGEAMVLGMPIVSSYVGGLPSMMTHEKEGFFFPVNEDYVLAGYIEKLFHNKELAIACGERAHLRAKVTHDSNTNIKDVLECYNNICGDL